MVEVSLDLFNQSSEVLVFVEEILILVKKIVYVYSVVVHLYMLKNELLLQYLAQNEKTEYASHAKEGYMFSVKKFVIDVKIGQVEYYIHHRNAEE